MTCQGHRNQRSWPNQTEAVRLSILVRRIRADRKPSTTEHAGLRTISTNSVTGLLAMTNLGPHSPFLATNFSSSFSSLLRSHTPWFSGSLQVRWQNKLFNIGSTIITQFCQRIKLSVYRVWKSRIPGVHKPPNCLTAS